MTMCIDLCSLRSGLSGIVWYVFWLFLVYERPSQHPRISHQELSYIETSFSLQQRTRVVSNYVLVWDLPGLLELLCVHFLFPLPRFFFILFPSLLSFFLPSLLLSFLPSLLLSRLMSLLSSLLLFPASPLLPSSTSSSPPFFAPPQTSTPWLSIFTSWPVWAIIIAHCFNNWGFYTLLTSLPTYLKDTQGIDIQSVSGLPLPLPLPFPPFHSPPSSPHPLPLSSSYSPILHHSLSSLSSTPSSLAHAQDGLLSGIPYAVMAVVVVFWGYVTDFFRRRGLKTVIARKGNTVAGMYV